MHIYIYDAKRSPIGKFKRSLLNTSAKEIGVQIAKNIFKATKINKDLIDEVIVGNVLSAGQGQNVARQILIESDIPQERCAFSVNMVCGSGMKAINLAYNDIKLGNAHCVLAGGVENMSMSPILVNRVDNSKEPKDHMIYDALTDYFSDKHMGLTAENVAKKYKVTRQEQDNFSFESQAKVAVAQNSNRFDDEIVPIITAEGNKLEKDEFPRNDTTLEKLSLLKPAFKSRGTVTAGNASGINDGGALLLIGDETIKLDPLAEIIDFAEKGCDPQYMGFAPYYAVTSLLEKNSLTLDDIDLFEINEAFASQSVAVLKELCKHYKYDYNKMVNKTNVNGGAIALGHPVGASGARIVTTLVHEMKKQGSTYGVASLCIGGGMGIAMLIKM